MAFGDVTKKFQEEKAAKEATVAQAEATVEAHEEAVATAPAPDGAALLAQAIVEAINQNQPRKVPYGRHKATSAFDNPDGSPKPPMTRRYYQNGRLIYDHTVKSHEIQLLEMLKQGIFIDRLVTVVVRDTGPNGTEVHISYNCKTADQRMAVGSRVRNFAGLLRRCIKEAMALEEAEKARIRELARSKPKNAKSVDILNDDDDDLSSDDDFDV